VVGAVVGAVIGAVGAAVNKYCLGSGGCSSMLR
jgi:hypothetical protein